jgi:predicted transglutaminase-like cysteine proteinase
MRQGLKLTVFSGLAALCVAFPAMAADTSGGALGLVFAPAVASPAAASRWTEMVERMTLETPIGPCKAGKKGPGKATAAKTSGKPGPETGSAACRTAEWDRKIVKLRPRAPLQQLKAVNRGVNALTYVADAENWSQADYWATPQEMLARGGDCEDFATTKYFALLRLGFAAADLRVAVVWDQIDREQHAVLLARTGDRTLVLDNKRADLTPLAAVADRYQLLYSLEDGRIRLPLQVEAAPAANETARGRSQIINGGRTLVMQIQPRRRGSRPDPALPPSPRFEMALAETSAPAGR